jgi:alkylated DNA repair dioxygenase AlkB
MSPINEASSLAKIKGLIFLPDYITDVEQAALLGALNAETWLGDLKRRVQHYGYKYDYKARFVDYSMRLGALPVWAAAVANRLFEEDYMPAVADQLIVNQYEAGQGISNHIDCAPCFGDTVVSLSLGAACVMDFIHKTSKEKVEIFLPVRSVIILKDEARYDWQHGIAARKSDNFGGHKYLRGCRTSLTFRNIILH